MTFRKLQRRVLPVYQVELKAEVEGWMFIGSLLGEVIIKEGMPI